MSKPYTHGKNYAEDAKRKALYIDYIEDTAKSIKAWMDKYY